MSGNEIDTVEFVSSTGLSAAEWEIKMRYRKMGKERKTKKNWEKKEVHT